MPSVASVHHETAARAVRDEIIAKIRALAPGIAARSQEIEDARRVPDDIIGQLREIGVYRMATPREFGGLDLDYPMILEVLAELAIADSSVGWVSMLGAGHAPHLALLPHEVLAMEVYANGPDVFLAGSAAPAGTGERVEGGYIVSGRWPFASGCFNSDWLFAGFVVTKDGVPVQKSAAFPRPVLHAALPTRRWTIEDTWHVAGLKGTGSNHIVLERQFVPDSHSFAYTDPTSVTGPLYSSVFHLIPLLHCAPAIGIATGALGELIDLANAGKRQMFSTEPLRLIPAFQTELGRLDADIKAARALFAAQSKTLWDAALAGNLSLSDTEILSDCFQTSTWVTAACVAVVDACYRLGGGAALYNSSPLQRRLRDIHAAQQHAAVQPHAFTRSGAVRLGIPVRHPVVD